MEKRYEEMTICAEYYDTHEEYKEVIVKFIEILLQNNYIVALRDEGDIMCIEYNYRDLNLGEYDLRWVGVDEKIIGRDNE